MAWQDKDGASPLGTSPTEEVKHTFDLPVKLRVRGVAQPVQGTLLHIAISGCRVHAPVSMERGTGLSFEWRLSNGKLLDVAGVVAARYAPKNGGAGFEYAMALDAMSEDESDALEREAGLLVRSASARSYDTALVDISQFMNYRVPDDVRVSYRVDNPRTFGIGNACDITGNALRLNCADALRANETVHLAVRLPDMVLSVHRGSDDELVTAPMGTHQVPRKVLRQPFQEIQVSGRVVATVKDSKRRSAYEIELLEVNGLARQELARYIHASQLARFKK
jgi:hypothetical protein